MKPNKAILSAMCVSFIGLCHAQADPPESPDDDQDNFVTHIRNCQPDENDMGAQHEGSEFSVVKDCQTPAITAALEAIHVFPYEVYAATFEHIANTSIYVFFIEDERNTCCRYPVRKKGVKPYLLLLRGTCCYPKHCREVSGLTECGKQSQSKRGRSEKTERRKRRTAQKRGSRLLKLSSRSVNRRPPATCSRGDAFSQVCAKDQEDNSFD